MDLNELAHRITNFGQYLETIDYYNRRISLYSVDNQFYEMYYNQESNEIEKVNVVTDQEMAKYLNRITLRL